MIEIQCTSCHTRYRIDERVLPDDTPTFKCSRCGHVFNADPIHAKVRTPAPTAGESDSQPAQMLRPPRSRVSVVRPPVKSEAIAPAPPEQPEPSREQIEEPIPRQAASDSLRGRELDSSRESDSDDPLNRPFGEREQKSGTGENFRFDFSNEGHELDDGAREKEIAPPAQDDDRWEVGDASAEFEAEPDGHAPIIEAVEPAARLEPASAHRVAAALKAARPQAHPPQAAKAAGFELGQAADDSDDLPVLGKTHASGYFLATFFIVAIAFVAASSLICAEPAASAQMLSETPQLGPYFARPIVPAMLVAIHDVRAEYRTLKGGQVALLITGTAENVGARPLHLVQIDADLLGGGARPSARLSVYCGNELSAKMLGEMTPREIEFSQGLSPQRSFVMEQSGAAPFLMVFVNPPARAGKVRLSVSKAIAAENPEAGAGAAARSS